MTDLPVGAYRRSEQWSLAGADIQIPTSLGGRSQTVAGLTPLWAVTYTYRVNTKRSSTQWLEWEAWVSSRRGALISEDVEPPTVRMISPSENPISFDEGITFDDGLLFNGDFAALAEPAGQYATSIRVGDASTMAVGRFFFLGDAMYRVTSVSGRIIGFQPPLRKAMPTGSEAVNFGSLPMQLVSQGDGGLIVDFEGFSDVTVTMIEAI